MPDAKLTEFIRSGKQIRIDLADVIGHSAADFGEELIHFAVIPFHHQLNPAIGEVLDVATYIVPKGDVFDRISKTDPLNMTTEITRLAMSWLSGRRHEAG